MRKCLPHIKEKIDLAKRMITLPDGLGLSSILVVAFASKALQVYRRHYESSQQKNLPLQSLLLRSVVGLSGCFLAFFDMDKFVKFLGCVPTILPGMEVAAQAQVGHEDIQEGKHDRKRKQLLNGFGGIVRLALCYPRNPEKEDNKKQKAKVKEAEARYKQDTSSRSKLHSRPSK